MNIKCPYCNHENQDIDEYLPKEVSLDGSYTCVNCEVEFYIGWVAKAEVRGSKSNFSKEEMISFINNSHDSWSSFIIMLITRYKYKCDYMGWWVSDDGQSSEECYVASFNPCGDESGDIITINDTKLSKLEEK